MIFGNLSEKISEAFRKLRSKGKLSESDVKSSMREVRLALLEADVNFKVAKEFTNKVIDRAVGTNVMESLTPAQMVIKIVNEELTSLMGENYSKLNIPSRPPCIIMMCGLQGAGKTTHCAKLAKMLKKQGHRPLLVACDIYRPAAVKQLEVLSQSIGVPVFEEGVLLSPVEISKHAARHAKDYGNDIVIIDTAGRLHIDEKLMDELLNIKSAVNPSEILLVVDAMTGQDAVNAAKSFDEKLDISGIIMTKLDGDARGGAALSIKAITGKPIKFVGVGEKLDNIEVFHPDRMASRVLGMGDVLTLIEDAEINFDKKQAEKMIQKLEQNSFDLNDLMEQFKQVKKLGPLKSILGKLPGLDKHLKDVDIDDRVFDRTCAIILSMTKDERKKPSIINPSRKKRIAKGSGMKVEDVNKLLRQFEQMQTITKQFGWKGKGKRKFPRFRFPGMMK
ncbi:MAG: signal recognition particle protein [Oscillospiraceae bacterium]|nr:signal recognition particle protein [Oscillospiraceae bacterium]